MPQSKCIRHAIGSFIAVVGALSIYAGYHMYAKQKTAPGMVIILNGPSGSGKTSIQQAFQAMMMPDLWIKLGIDTLFDKPMPDITPENMHVWQKPNKIRWVETKKDAYGFPVVELFTGEQGKKVAYGMNSAIAAYARTGSNVIVDYIAYKTEWWQDLKYQLKDFITYYVAIRIPLEMLEEREKIRATSPIGHARSHYFTVYGAQKYDLEIDSSTMSAKEAANKIKEFIAIQQK